MLEKMARRNDGQRAITMAIGVAPGAYLLVAVEAAAIHHEFFACLSRLSERFSEQLPRG